MTSEKRPKRVHDFALTRWRGGTVDPRPCRIETRVRYAETDQMGVVYHANHLVWFEMGRVEWLDRLDLPYRAIEKEGLQLPVIEIGCRYQAPARFDETLVIETRFIGVTRARARFGYRLIGPTGIPIAEGYSEHAAVDKDLHPVRIPDWLLEVLDQPAESEEEQPA